MNFKQDCIFPVVILYDDGDVAAEETPHGLTICRKTDLKAGQSGRFARSTIIDSNGLAWRMDGAEKLHGVGPLWGYNLFLNQTVRVRPTILGEPKPATLQFIKSELGKRLNKPDALTITLKIGCATIDREAARALIPQLEQATSPSQIINILLTVDFPERQRWEQNPAR